MKKGNVFDRRRFLKQSSLGTMGVLLAGMNSIELKAEPTAAAAAAGGGSSENPVKCAVIGLGPWGRELVDMLSQVEGASVVAICDTYAPFVRRVSRGLSEARQEEDYRKVLEDPEVEAVFVATPSHQHKQIAIEALEAGKHVYCEAPLAAEVEEAREIARAARSASGQVFQAGLQMRSEPQHHHVLQFVRAGAVGDLSHSRSQWCRKHSWRRAAPTNEREREINWRLERDISPGLLGEESIHYIDTAAWFLGSRPESVHAFGGLFHWRDGRNVADSVQAVLQFPRGHSHSHQASIVSSYADASEIFCGSDSSIMLKGSRAWMFREADAPLLGWEVYARQEEIMEQTGISLVADATQLLAAGMDPATDAPEPDPPLLYALENFVRCIRQEEKPPAGYQEGFEATVVALRANEALLGPGSVEFSDADFSLDA